MNKEYENIASQCAASATSDMAKIIIVDAGSGLLRELLNDSARAIRALNQPLSVSNELIKAGDAMHFEITKEYSAERAELAARWIIAKHKGEDIDERNPENEGVNP